VANTLGTGLDAVKKHSQPAGRFPTPRLTTFIASELSLPFQI